LKGVRHVLHDEPDDDYMLRQDFNRGIASLRRFGLAYDLLIFERHLPQTLALVRRHPDQVFIVDHIAKPRIREGLLSPWRERMKELAAFPNVYCKVSGMVTEAHWQEWTGRDLAPYFDAVLEAFGPRRLMFGSDWPVLLLASSYGRWVETFRRAVSRLTGDEQSWIEHRTAEAAYRLETAGGAARK
jgi:L-fuconolactonase